MRTIAKVFLLLIITLLNVFAQKPTYNIKAKIIGLPEDKFIYLAHYYFGNSQYSKIDSAKAKNSTVEFIGKEELKGGIYLIVLSSDRYYDLVISGLEKNISLEADTADFVNSVKFTNSPENDLIYTYRRFLAEKSKEASRLQKIYQNNNDDKVAQKDASDKLMALQEAVNAHIKAVVNNNPKMFAAKVIKANIEPEIPAEDPILPNGKRDSLYRFNLYKKKYFDNLDFSDDRFLQTPFIQTKVEKYFKDLVYQVTDSIILDADKVLKLAKKNSLVYRYVLWMISNKYETTDIVGLDGVFIHLAENYYLKDADWLDSTQRARFKDRVDILKPIMTGKVFPNFILEDTTGRVRTVFDTKAKYTIIYLYSPDCGHCRDHAPDLVKFYDENKPKGYEIYNISILHDRKKTVDFIKTYNTGKMINLWDAKTYYDLTKRYDAYMTPTAFILDSQKRILARINKLEEISKFIEFYERKIATESKGK
jgi:thiol-disulfide isomerase/thioredoxin